MIWTNRQLSQFNQLSHRWPAAPGQLTFCGSPHSIQTCPSGRDTQNNMMQGIAVLLFLSCSCCCWIWCKCVFLLHRQYLSVKAQPERCSQLQMEKRNRKKNSLGDCIVPLLPTKLCKIEIWISIVSRSTKFLVVRHPFDRIVSAYKGKISRRDAKPRSTILVMFSDTLWF